MARTKSALDALSGIVGPVIFKQYRDKLVVTSRPRTRNKKKRSANQKENSSMFKYAVAYAKNIVNDPEKKAEFAKKLKKNASVYHAAIQDFFANHAS
jgi:hypothetical protein